ncbi:MAG: NAD(P)/FAD-dependent oxidoreductase [Candidatus Scalindua sp. AMX11]|nr:MAG: NAD(P)/FAD-dependent oxidoreductase [Candidatus Scalindua sp.]NOG83426.1 NAD(P)/FAD-dependent oxidoreductase [Planctomycetota bacterium]RZV75100.1 MAG: NAD(P)/FAD-dependent oxidoreductase [Candidatus Scalindua sp. SCAELEC01]TDE64352.1 MAG: NAD(P)/FAD-dependent oxidoreductase [Candidatus Scalindua sp. AMX11]
MQQFEVVIIGAGAAGLMCAHTAGRRGRTVLLLDRAESVGEKIQISGGGHCNFTNLLVGADNYLSNNPHFCKSALKRFTQFDFIQLVEKHKIGYHEKTLGQLFCNGGAGEIVRLLVDECLTVGVEIQKRCVVKKIEKEGYFSITTNRGNYRSESLVIATGGLSMLTEGAAHLGYEVAKQFDIDIVACQPGLVPLTLSTQVLKDMEGLSGISVDVLVSCNGHSFHGSMLFTHNGLSGPVILQISNYWGPGDEIVINLLPGCNIGERIEKWKSERPKVELKNLIGELLTKRLANRWLEPSVRNKPVNQYNSREIDEIFNLFHKWHVLPAGTEGYRKAEVTRGGVDTNELSSKTFEAKRVGGLYFIGEVLDVTGWLGGYNLQWAWSSGYCAGQYV